MTKQLNHSSVWQTALRNFEQTAQRLELDPLVCQKILGPKEKIEARITNPIKPTKTKTNAPPPVDTLGGPSADVIPDEKKSKAQLHAKWEKARRERIGV